ncbi:hypothetical protein Pmar_PMAR006025 [Perkinsus marinus ATCC 50983]|uniref:Uncharacterized protein n=1 Tax=Perkinsus marinus (strain ATCC 50983 / TXsc) TaxID=423536 RepID=C5LA04_PERM5|nr:hypothetical protein Pmar_PMAR006025 [Perkinsus marinus ATCC 50983]EER06260.1 hypothetical protein Pmar_PMAR006025 [Perkinsus marinus ATCC 50983]|eukprot:XP_002774444.1 hypothetical protein Pmar_PMAR006025 [Perkinsus marinus ATCC 50983]
MSILSAKDVTALQQVRNFEVIGLHQVPIVGHGKASTGDSTHVPRPLRKRSSTSYGSGIFVGATVEILSFGLVGDVYPGCLCDALYAGHRCPCIVTDLVPPWVVQLVIEVEVEAENEEGELNRVGLEDEFAITSSSLTKLFATDNVRKISLESDFVEASSVSDIVDFAVARVNQNGGWTLVLWSKASKAQNDSEGGIKPPRNHLVHLSPSALPEDINVEILGRRYDGQPARQGNQDGNNGDDQQRINNVNAQQGANDGTEEVD